MDPTYQRLKRPWTLLTRDLNGRRLKRPDSDGQRLKRPWTLLTRDSNGRRLKRPDSDGQRLKRLVLNSLVLKD
uniref:Uncharacterized protein n=1 Tax=Meloidogyne enterolobii TaxID=390850 RepID=A0A6V7WK84_MELEN|nr:unnamed protein product [Meloidogyne enterolobii]